MECLLNYAPVLVAVMIFLIQQRIVITPEQLEKKQDQVNNVIERTYKLEGQMVEVQHDIRDLKAERR